MPAKKTNSNRCPNHLNRRASKLGVCTACYNTFYGRVRRGMTSWDELRAGGLISDPGKRGRPRKEFKAAF